MTIKEKVDCLGEEIKSLYFQELEKNNYRVFSVEPYGDNNKNHDIDDLEIEGFIKAFKVYFKNSDNYIKAAHLKSEFKLKYNNKSFYFCVYSGRCSENYLNDVFNLFKKRIENKIKINNRGKL